jgi:imidazole glycerol-phosphate synthase
MIRKDLSSESFTFECVNEYRKSDGLYVLDYGAGNVRSLYNAIRKIGYRPKRVECPGDIDRAKKLIFPGVGSFGSAMKFLKEKGYFEPLRRYLLSGKPYFGICIGMQALFRSSEESSGAIGLGIIDDAIKRFPDGKDLPTVPHIGWNGIRLLGSTSDVFSSIPADARLYFVHSFRAKLNDKTKSWAMTLTDYGEPFVSAIQQGSIVATQFHPEKSGEAGLKIIEAFLSGQSFSNDSSKTNQVKQTVVSRRVVAGLDVRPDDDGRLVVTKGDGYDVRDSKDGKRVRNLGDPVDLAHRYFVEGADEIVFLNIKAGAVDILKDTPMMKVLERASEKIFVPLTIGGGIRSYTSKSGVYHSALDVAAAYIFYFCLSLSSLYALQLTHTPKPISYFRSGADKVSIGSAAVRDVERYIARGEKADGTSCIESIVNVYGRQAVVVSIDPRRVYLGSKKEEDEARKNGYTIVQCADIRKGPRGETQCWYQCTVKGGRETRPLDAVRFATCCDKLGAGELLINCIDQDGRKQGFDLELINAICEHVNIPVIASSGAGSGKHFSQVFTDTRGEAALGAGIFHRREVAISEVKDTMRRDSIPTR